jgi:hypothetical protein
MAHPGQPRLEAGLCRPGAGSGVCMVRRGSGVRVPSSALRNQGPRHAPGSRGPAVLDSRSFRVARRGAVAGRSAAPASLAPPRSGPNRLRGPRSRVPTCRPATASRPAASLSVLIDERTRRNTTVRLSRSTSPEAASARRFAREADRDEDQPCRDDRSDQDPEEGPGNHPGESDRRRHCEHSNRQNPGTSSVGWRPIALVLPVSGPSP